ncbi:hypothetical protein [Cryobacterium sp. Hb1]|uniref:hypothetical protein n=1 Tax=Cryobacterium sp. Hb1 TaxID=1259147 RepID=UPI00106A8AA3|nr:hypothetical protein [Cryobacterium sp. Hb1]TFD64598.1 hypothetical protein E3T38_15895 [Cryobacterium sp. Hb1]
MSTPSAGLEAAYRATLRWYPRGWRVDNEDAVVGTLLDVADAEQRTRPQTAELLNLAVCGLLRRIDPVLPAQAREVASAVAFACGAALSLTILLVSYLGPLARQIVPPWWVGPSDPAGALPYALWLIACVFAMAGHRRTARWSMVAVLASVAALAVLRSTTQVTYSLPSWIALAFMLSLAVMALIASPLVWRGTLGVASIAALAFAVFAGGAAVAGGFGGRYHPERWVFETVLSPSNVGVALVFALATVGILAALRLRVAAAGLAAATLPWAVLWFAGYFAEDVVGSLVSAAVLAGLTVVAASAVALWAWLLRSGIAVPRRLAHMVSAPAVWTAPILIALMVWGTRTANATWTTLPYWNAVVSVACYGLPIAVLTAAVVTAWESSRMRRYASTDQPVPATAYLARLSRRVWPTLVGSIAGYLVTLALLVQNSGVPKAGTPNLLVPAASLAVLLSAFAFGALLGRLCHTAIAVPTALVASYLWFALPSAQGASNPAWLNITGFGLPQSSFDFSFVPATGALLAPILLSVAVVATFALVLFLRRAVVGYAAGAVLVTAAVLVGNVLVAGIGQAPYAPRPVAELVCSGDATAVCLWPEQDAVDGARILNAVVEARVQASKNGLTLPDRVEASSSAFTAHQNADVSYLTSLPGPGASTQQIKTAYATSLLESISCGDATQTADAAWQALRAQSALTMLVGAGTTALLQKSTPLFAPDDGALTSLFAARQALDVGSIDNARKVLNSWRSETKKLCNSRPAA